MARPSERIPAVTLYADKEEIQTAFGIASKSWTCHTCDKEFSLLESMGSLQCWQHPGYIQKNGKWSCCGQKIYPARWSRERPVTRMFHSKQPYPIINKVRGCQRCDHNTSEAPFTHKDAQNIAELSALLPHINKEYPFPLRKGFENGILRRCERRKIVVPENAAVVEYQDNAGNIQTYDVDVDVVIPEGIEIKAHDDFGQPITEWQ